MTAHCRTDSCCDSTDSISPSSILYPLTFTCWSILPTYSISPPSTHLTLSPVRYALLPSSSLSSSGTYLSPVCPPSLQYPRPTPTPPIHSSPSTPSPTISHPLPFTYTLVFEIALPILTVAPSSSTSHS